MKRIFLLKKKMPENKIIAKMMLGMKFIFEF